MPAPEARNHMLTAMTMGGWLASVVDDAGIQATKPLDGAAAWWHGNKHCVARVNVTPIDAGSQISAVLRFDTWRSSSDFSGGDEGVALQLLIERAFDHVRIDGPYVDR
jgi:hypothetical protein